MAMAVVSIIIPTYNRAHLVAEAVESVLNQTYRDFELIVVDDGSTDNTEEIVRSFLDDRVKYVKQSNKGVSAARNMGIATAKGDFIAFLDHDDLFLPEKLSVQLARMRYDPKVGLVYSLYFGTMGTEAPRRLAGACHSPVELHHLLLGSLIHLSTALVRRSYLQQVGGFDEQLRYGGEDRDICLRLVLAGCEMVCVANPLTIIRQQPNSLARASFDHREETWRVVLDRAFSDPRMPPEMQALRTRAFATQLVRVAAWGYTGLSPDIGRDFLERALVIDPTLANENIGFLVNKLVDYVIGLSLGDPENTLQLMRSHLPGDNIFINRLWRRLCGRFYEAAAFQAYQSGQRAKCITYVIRAVGQTRSSLRNRGLLSIFVRSFVGNQVSHKTTGLPRTLPTKDSL
jgi:glycosyltransferase involved in cell wall biosynthesis